MITINSIGKQLKTLRKERKITQQELADTIGVKRSTLANYEIDRRAISLADLIKLADFYGVGLDYFGLNNNKNEIFDLLCRASSLFRSDRITADEKEMLHQEMLKLYLQITNEKKEGKQ